MREDNNNSNTTMNKRKRKRKGVMSIETSSSSNIPSTANHNSSSSLASNSSKIRSRHVSRLAAASCKKYTILFSSDIQGENLERKFALAASQIWSFSKTGARDQKETERTASRRACTSSSQPSTVPINPSTTRSEPIQKRAILPPYSRWNRDHNKSINLPIEGFSVYLIPSHPNTNRILPLPQIKATNPPLDHEPARTKSKNKAPGSQAHLESTSPFTYQNTRQKPNEGNNPPQTRKIHRERVVYNTRPRDSSRTLGLRPTTLHCTTPRREFEPAPRVIPSTIGTGVSIPTRVTDTRADSGRKGYG